MLEHAINAFSPEVATPVERYNTFADWMFYDVSNLTTAEFNYLASNSFKEGSILVVEPAAGDQDIAIRKYLRPEHMQFNKYVNSAAIKPQKNIKVLDFAIAGVGSSDVGAASLARTRANQLGRPVGAIVAGYGISDIMQEALGGWFFFGKANRIQAFVDMYRSYLPNSAYSNVLKEEKDSEMIVSGYPNDTRTLLNLLKDKDRKVNSVVGHSKGCLSIAFAFNDIADNSDGDAFDRINDVEIITAGAVVELPKQLSNVKQYLGAIDWFGGMNSIPTVKKVSVPNAWHHLNTKVPFHMDFAEVLSGKYG